MLPKLIIHTPKSHCFYYLQENAPYPLELARSGRAHYKHQYSLDPFLWSIELQVGYNLVDLTSLEVTPCGTDPKNARKAMLEVRSQQKQKVRPVVQSKKKVKTKPKQQGTLDLTQYASITPEYQTAQEKIKLLHIQAQAQRLKRSQTQKIRVNYYS